MLIGVTTREERIRSDQLATSFSDGSERLKIDIKVNSIVHSMYSITQCKVASIVTGYKLFYLKKNSFLILLPCCIFKYSNAKRK